MKIAPMVILCTDELDDPEACQALANVALAKLVRDGGGVLTIGPSIFVTATDGGGLLMRFHPDGGLEITFIPSQHVQFAKLLNPDEKQNLLNCALMTLVRDAGNSLIVPALAHGEAETTHGLNVRPVAGGIEVMAVSGPLAKLLQMAPGQ